MILAVPFIEIGGKQKIIMASIYLSIGRNSVTELFVNRQEI